MWEKNKRTKTATSRKPPNVNLPRCFKSMDHLDKNAIQRIESGARFVRI